MNATHVQTPSGLVFAPQVAFSWTRRWARAHRDDRAAPTRRTYRIAGSASSEAELTAVIAFCETHAARLQVD